MKLNNQEKMAIRSIIDNDNHISVDDKNVAFHAAVRCVENYPDQYEGQSSLIWTEGSGSNNFNKIYLHIGGKGGVTTYCLSTDDMGILGIDAQSVPEIVYRNGSDMRTYDVFDEDGNIVFIGNHEEIVGYLEFTRKENLQIPEDFKKYNSRWCWEPSINRIYCDSVDNGIMALFTPRHELWQSDQETTIARTMYGRILQLLPGGKFVANLGGSRYFAAEVLDALKCHANSTIIVEEEWCE